MYYLVEYLIYIVAAALLGALLFATTSVVVLSSEGAKRLATGSSKVAERTLRALEGPAKSAIALIAPVSANAKRV